MTYRPRLGAYGKKAVWGASAGALLGVILAVVVIVSAWRDGILFIEPYWFLRSLRTVLISSIFFAVLVSLYGVCRLAARRRDFALFQAIAYACAGAFYGMLIGLAVWLAWPAHWAAVRATTPANPAFADFQDSLNWAVLLGALAGAVVNLRRGFTGFWSVVDDIADAPNKIASVGGFLSGVIATLGIAGLICFWMYDWVGPWAWNGLQQSHTPLDLAWYGAPVALFLWGFVVSTGYFFEIIGVLKRRKPLTDERAYGSARDATARGIDAAASGRGTEAPWRR